jgi:hypothetical protein
MTALFVSRNVSGGKSGFLAVSNKKKREKQFSQKGKDCIGEWICPDVDLRTAQW